MCRTEFSRHRGIATAQPYQSSFSVTVRHLSVSLAQLAGPVSCGTKQHRWNLRMCFHRRGFVSELEWKHHRSPSNVVAKGEVSLRRCHVNMIFEGVAHSQCFYTIGTFLIPAVVWDIFCLHISSGNAFNRNQMLCKFYLLC